MKALGVGLGAFPFHRRRGGPARPRRALLVLHGAAAAWPAGRGGPVAPVPDPHRPGGHGPGGGRGPAPGRWAGPRSRPRPSPDRAATSRSVDADAAGAHRLRDERGRRRALPSSRPLDVLVGRAGLAVALAALDHARRRLRASGGGGGRTGQQRGRRPGRRRPPGPSGGPGPTWSRRARPTPSDRCDLVIDAAYGTGFRGEYRSPARCPRAPRCWPSTSPRGSRATPGRPSGAPVAADRTVTFVALKPGLLQGDGARLAGAVEVADIGLPTGDPPIAVMDDGDVAALFPRRRPGGNKWSAAVLVVAGSPGMTGAAALCARAAYRAGAGMVRLGVPGCGLSEAPATRGGERGPAGRGVGRRTRSRRRPAARPWWSGPGWAAARDGRGGAAPGGRVAGAGGGRRRRAVRPRAGVGGRPAPLQARSPVVLTPHDGEYARLMAGDPGPDRIGAARRLARRSGAVALLKGPDHRGGRPRRPGALGRRAPPPWPPPAPATCCPG